MRTLVFCVFAAVALAQPECRCNPGKFYPAAALTSTLGGGGVAGQYGFENCRSALPAETKCTDGTAIGENAIGESEPIAGLISAKCIVDNGSNQGLLQGDTILGNSFPNQALLAPERQHKSACCGACRPGYRLKEVEQQINGVNTAMGFVCTPQICQSEISTFSGTAVVTHTVVNANQGVSPVIRTPQCECKVESNPASRTAENTFFSSTYLPADVSDVLKISNNIPAFEQSSVFSTDPEWSQMPGQGSCVQFSSENCFTPNNCDTSGQTSLSLCIRDNQPWATRCEQCQAGFNIRDVACYTAAGTPDLVTPFDTNPTGPTAHHIPKNKCQICVVTNIGCGNGTIAS